MISRDSSLRIGVLRLSALGDCINAFGMIGALQQSYPNLQLCMVIDSRFASLFCDDNNKALIPLLPVNFKQQGLKAILELRRMNRHFDQVFNMQTSIKASLCSTMLKAPIKWGYDKEREREGQRFFINRRIAPPKQVHVLSGFMSFATSAGFELDQPYWNFQISEQQLALARQTLAADKVLALIPCSAKAEKNWTIAGYQAVIEHALGKGIQVVLLGGLSRIESEICGQLHSHFPHIINLQGQTNLRELASYLKVSTLTIAPDSGGMHLSSALGTPVIGLFARHNPKRVGPWNFMDLNVSVYNKLAQEELNSNQIPWRYHVKTPNAMEQISIDQVLAMFDHALVRYNL